MVSMSKIMENIELIHHPNRRVRVIHRRLRRLVGCAILAAGE
jgi:hypothetical protein